MQKIYRHEFVIDTTSCDFLGRWRPSAILEAMQEAAGTHAELLGIGRAALLRQDLVWILTRTEVVMDRYPLFGETVTLETFPAGHRRWFMPRYFRFLDKNGEQIGYAGSLWALLDVNTRRMAAPDPILAYFPDNSDLPAPMGLPALVGEVEGSR